MKTKTRPLSKGWENIITEGSKHPPKIKYKKDSVDWIYKYLGWKKNGRRTP